MLEISVALPTRTLYHVDFLYVQPLSGTISRSNTILFSSTRNEPSSKFKLLNSTSKVFDD